MPDVASRVRDHVHGLRPYHVRTHAHGHVRDLRGPSVPRRSANRRRSDRSGDGSKRPLGRAVLGNGPQPNDNDALEAPRSRQPIPLWARAVVVAAVHMEWVAERSRWKQKLARGPARPAPRRETANKHIAFSFASPSLCAVRRPGRTQRRMLSVFTRAATLLKPHYRPNADLLGYSEPVCMTQKQPSLFPRKWRVLFACLEEQYSKVVCRKSWPLVTDIA